MQATTILRDLIYGQRQQKGAVKEEDENWLSARGQDTHTQTNSPNNVNIAQNSRKLSVIKMSMFAYMKTITSKCLCVCVYKFGVSFVFGNNHFPPFRDAKDLESS